jgi:hypothetical protein
MPELTSYVTHLQIFRLINHQLLYLDFVIVIFDSSHGEHNEGTSRYPGDVENKSLWS